ncbi:MAG: hypothetical protein ABJF23_24800 [Bryobacteraceae bacterium]
MSTQSIAVETIVVAALKDLFDDESALETKLDQFRHSAEGADETEALFNSLMDLDARARRIERLLDAMERNEPYKSGIGIC